MLTDYHYLNSLRVSTAGSFYRLKTASYERGFWPEGSGNARHLADRNEHTRDPFENILEC